MMWWWVIGLGLLLLVIFLFAGKSKKGPVEESRKSPLNILKERYAKGEISEEEFENQNETLNEN